MSNFDGMLLCDHSVFIHETVFSCWANFQVFEFISIYNNTQFGYVDVIAIIFILCKPVSRTILPFMYSRVCPLARSCTKFIALHNNNVAVLFSSQKLTDLQRSFDSDGQERNVKVCITIL